MSGIFTIAIGLIASLSVWSMVYRAVAWFLQFSVQIPLLRSFVFAGSDIPWAMLFFPTALALMAGGYVYSKVTNGFKGFIFAILAFSATGIALEIYFGTACYNTIVPRVFSAIFALLFLIAALKHNEKHSK